MPECYLTLLENLDRLMTADLTFIPASKYPAAEKLRRSHTYPVGLLGNAVELHFMHFADEEEVAAKWTRRLARFDRDRLFVKMCDRDGCTDEHIRRFAALPFERKVCFVSRPNPGLKDVVYFPGYEDVGELPVDLIDRVDAVFDTAYWIRTGRHQRTPAGLRCLHSLLIDPPSPTERPSGEGRQ